MKQRCRAHLSSFYTTTAQKIFSPLAHIVYQRIEELLDNTDKGRGGREITEFDSKFVLRLDGVFSDCLPHKARDHCQGLAHNNYRRLQLADKT